MSDWNEVSKILPQYPIKVPRRVISGFVTVMDMMSACADDNNPLLHDIGFRSRHREIYSSRDAIFSA